MALILGSSIAKGSIFALEDYEAAFHPWWDSLQDYIMYSAIIVGLFSFPTANTKAECAPLYPNTTAPAHHAFVNGFCTTENLPLFISYFPYLVFLGPTLLAILERFFTKSSSIGAKMNHFYRLLVEESKRRESLTHNLKTRQSKEIENVYNMSSSFFMTYTVKNLLQFIVSVAYFVWMGVNSHGTIFMCEGSSCELINYRSCKLGKVELTCLVSDVNFYLYVLIILGVLMLIYILANLFTLLWITIRPIRKLGRFLSTYKRGVNGYYRGEPKSPDAAALLDVYGGIKSLDVEILLDLLAEKMGLEMALKILTLIDVEFNRDWRVQPKEGGPSESGSSSLTLEFDEPPITRYIGSAFQSKTIFIARIDITASTASALESQSQAFLYDKVQRGPGRGQVGVAIEGDDKIFNKRYQELFSARFNNLSPGQKYNIVLSSFLNGTLMGETVVNAFTRPEPPQHLDYKWKYDFSNSDIQFRLELTWSNLNRGEMYLIEIENSSFVITSQTNRAKYSQVTDLREQMKVRVWTLSEGGTVKSELALEREIESVPTDMQSLADHFKKQSPPTDINNYAYRLALLGQVTKELKDLYEEIQKVASFSKPSNGNDGERNEDSKTILEDAREDSGLAEMDL